MKARSIATSGLLVALQLLTLLVAYIVPTIKLALLFASAVYPAVLLRIGFGKKAIFAAFIAASILTALLIQVPEIQGGFIAFFGWYALVHETTKPMGKVKKQIIRWVLFAASLGLMYIAITFIFPLTINYALWLIALASVAAFIFMQILFEFTVKGFIQKTHIKYINQSITFK